MAAGEGVPEEHHEPPEERGVGEGGMQRRRRLREGVDGRRALPP